MPRFHSKSSGLKLDKTVKICKKSIDVIDVMSKWTKTKCNEELYGNQHVSFHTSEVSWMATMAPFLPMAKQALARRIPWWARKNRMSYEASFPEPLAMSSGISALFFDHG